MGLLSWVAWRLIGDEAVARDGEYIVCRDTDDAETQQRIADELGLPAFRNPVETLTELEDSEDRIYVWEVPEEPNRNALMNAFDKNGVHDMDALHIVLTDKEELTQFGPDDLRPYVDASMGADE